MSRLRITAKKLAVSGAVAALALASPAHADSMDEVLAQSHLTKDQVTLDSAEEGQFGGAEFKSPLLRALRERPLKIPFYAQTLRDVSLSQLAQPDELLVTGLGRLGIGTRRSILGDPLAAIEKATEKPGALALAIAHTHSAGGKSLTAGQASALRKKIAKLPSEVQSLAAYLIEAELASLVWRNRALSQMSRTHLLAAFAERTAPPSLDGEDDLHGSSPLLRRLMMQTDFATLMVGGIDLAHAVAKATAKLAAWKPAAQFDFEWSTPLGVIALQGTGSNNTYSDRPYLLIVDAGGDDTYYGGGASFDIDHPVSILIDAQGNDRYLAHTGLAQASVGERAERKAKGLAPKFGAGVFGYGILADLAGDDTYRSFRHTQGSGDFGVGMLWDLAGNDRYESDTQSQGAGAFGAGLLLDAAGDDRYGSFQQTQGFGGIFGVGLLVDGGTGKDAYEANDTQIDFPSLVDKKHNTSFAQGTALGLRADFIDQHSLAGGFGALVDGGGDNSLVAGFFSQGAAYWYGVGLLSVGAGNDRYEAAKYAQGAATHFAVGILHDTGGNDHHRVAAELGLGEGHDFGVGYFIDDAGDDEYVAPSLALGCGSACGIGIFWDRGGKDHYVTPDPETLGCASFRGGAPSFRTGLRTLGIFLDTGGGKNQFDTSLKEPKGTVSSGDWIRPGVGPDAAMPMLIGIGMVSSSP